MFVAFALYLSGAPLTGFVPTLVTYKSLAGVNRTKPTVVEVGGGLYGFTPTQDDIDTGVVYEISSTQADTRFGGSVGQAVGFALYDDAGNPLTGATPTIVSYKSPNGANRSAPSIVEVGAGLYGFIPSPSDYDALTCYEVSSGAANPSRFFGSLDPVVTGGGTVPPADDITSPTVVLSRSLDARVLEVLFSENVNMLEAMTASHYSIDNGLTVSSVAKVTDSIYRLTTSRQSPGVSYTVTVSGIHDLSGNLI